MERTFVYLKMYEQKAQKLGISWKIEVLFETLILEKPDRGTLISETGGARKIRVSSPGTKRGKSGSFRFFYIDLASLDLVFVLTAIHKSQSENLFKSEKKELKNLISILKEGVM
jgi:mRNA-degrading endonuclease RelE of RelBE toxin-antitoxin system